MCSKSSLPPTPSGNSGSQETTRLARLRATGRTTGHALLAGALQSSSMVHGGGLERSHLVPKWLRSGPTFKTLERTALGPSEVLTGRDRPSHCNGSYKRRSSLCCDFGWTHAWDANKGSLETLGRQRLELAAVTHVPPILGIVTHIFGEQGGTGKMLVRSTTGLYGQSK